MGGVMHPGGPESPETYWRRRALVVGIFLVVLIVVLVALFDLSGSPGQAAPTSPSAGPTGSPAAPTSSPVASPSAAATHSSGGSTTTASGKSSGKSSSAASSRPSADSSKSPKPVSACAASDLKATVTSKTHHVRIGSKVTLDVSYVNKSDQPCKITISPDTFELTITSGTDRIWSTADCARLVPSKKITLTAGHGVGWSVNWNGKRSLQGASCKSRPETPLAGYYHASAQLNGGTPQDYILDLG